MRGVILRNIQISESLFLSILKYHLCKNEEVLPEIEKGLNEKLEALIRRDLYTDYKMAQTEAEREKAREEYVDRVGISKEYRW